MVICISSIFLTHSPLEILPKNVSWSLSSGFLIAVMLLRAKTYHKALCRWCLLIQLQNISLRSSGMCWKQNFEIVFEFKSDTVVLTFAFHFLSSPLFSLFLPLFSFFAGHLVGFILVGKVFRKAFRILRLAERKDRWGVEQDFHGNFRVNVTCFLPFSPVSLTELCSFWYGLKDLFTLHTLADKIVLDH